MASTLPPVKGAKVQRTCIVCGKPFERYTAHIRKPTQGLYCSRACFYKRNGGKERRTCRQCGAEFELRPCEARDDPGRFCSYNCYWQWMKGRNTGADSPAYKDRIVATCKQCGKTFEDYPSRLRVFCSTTCHGLWLSEHQVGENHPHWLGGRDDYPSDWFTARQRVRRNGGTICALCHKSEQENGRAMSIHHIDYDKDNLEERNLVPLCDSCHAKTNFNRPYWQAMLTIVNRVPSPDWQHRQVM